MLYVASVEGSHAVVIHGGINVSAGGKMFHSTPLKLSTRTLIPPRVLLWSPYVRCDVHPPSPVRDMDPVPMQLSRFNE